MSNAERAYPAPSINMETETYWEAATRGILLLKKCEACGETHFYPRVMCPNCFSPDTVWYEASGRGKIYSFSIMRRAEVPYVIAYVTLAEGVTMMSNIVDCDFDSLEIDQDVEVTFRDAEDGQALPVFRPVQ